MPTEQQAGAILSIDLAAIATNWRRVAELCGGTKRCAAVVKADAYGLGVAKIGPVLFSQGCRMFFVAHIAEAIVLKTLLPEGSNIAVFNGPPLGTEADFTAYGLIPVLNCLDQITRWSAHARTFSDPLPAILHVDTGMSRLGLTAQETQILREHPELLEGVSLKLIMSHLACADMPAHPMNITQVKAFTELKNRFPGIPGSLANSSGIFLGPSWHSDLSRPGAAIYGLNPTPTKLNPMQTVVRLQGKVIQVREINLEETVGYGATYRACKKSRIATVAVGYADGFFRVMSNRGNGRIGTVRVPLVGRISMDLITFDISALPENTVHPGSLIDLIDLDYTADALAAEAGTIGYEILTALGERYYRSYIV